ncbi:carbohydrate ABC transporter substrate-binding protein, CUT1 family [Microbispora rosea]|uniref:Carbohydrate ABC transporter substrate-binding protein, CUT1 family n=1 Tax=Microbispora rosea TaxID=58117 RepID=A0A1N7BLN4_9ACTN|nr:extracellular solute-binding protein [Microbispora rosea]GIH46091.1 sugar ABC transporter substrate-binding protein [Microbispora rosea subsp. rosea]SIR52265.1 carbohydrate ABC transporter substrate-binding protein, CUT1 family [Microbispora rosea]
MSRRTRWNGAALAVVMGGALAAGCGAPGGDAPQPEATSASLAAAPTCGTAPVTLNAYIETGFPLPKELSTEFSKQYPNVKWNIREDQFAVITQNAPRVLADDPPDLMRLPQVSELVKNNLLKNLDGYAKAFGWDAWPASQLEQMRLAPGGKTRGEGSLYAMGLNFSMTGVFYNKKLADKIGMSSPPTTLAELDDALAKAKSAGITPIAQFNGGATGGLAFPLQDLMASYGPSGPINDWIYQKPGATIDTPSNVQATQHLEKWIKAGYFWKDVNAVDYATMMSRFIKGDGLFSFNGDWESGNLDKQMAGNVGFFLMPPAQQGGKQAAMSAPLTYGISSRAKNADCAAFFLNWVATDPKAREIGVKVGGSHPMGPADAPMPEVAKDTVTASTLSAGAKIAEDNGSMDFIANATGAIYAKSWTPQLQKLVAGQQTPEELLKSVQSDYTSQVGGS